MKSRKIEEIIDVPEKTEVRYENGFFIAKGPEGELKKRLVNPLIDVNIKEKKIRLASRRSTKRGKKLICSFKSHLKNLMNGVNKKYVYELKIYSGHFPMNVSVKGNEFIVKNFFGESIPRILDIKKGVEVMVEGDTITVESVNKELAGQVSADIEKLTRRTNYDRRIFQDGCYITKKAGKPIK